MTYIESALFDFVKSIFTRGIRTLKSPRFLPYTSVLLIIVLFSTIATFLSQIVPNYNISADFIDLILYVELSAAIAFVFTGMLLGRSNAKIQLPVIFSIIIGTSLTMYLKLIIIDNTYALVAVAIFYILWIGITTFSTFSLFRDLFGSNIFGTILFLGKQEDDGRPLFSGIGWILAILNFSLGLLLLKEAPTTALVFTSYVIMFFALIAVIPLFNFQKKNDVFFSVLNAFYMFSTIKVILLVFRVMTATAGETSFWDSIFSMFIALYAVQGAAVKGVKIAKKSTDMTLEEQLMDEAKGLGLMDTISKIFSDRGIILIILGVLLGYHSMQVQASFNRQNLFSNVSILSGSDIVILGYEFSVLISLFIFTACILLFPIVPKFRAYANPEVKRIPWAPEYDDLKLMLAGIKTGDVEWKADAAKLAMGLAKDTLKAKLGIKTNREGRIQETLDKLMRKKK